MSSFASILVPQKGRVHSGRLEDVARAAEPGTAERQAVALEPWPRRVVVLVASTLGAKVDAGRDAVQQWLEEGGAAGDAAVVHVDGGRTSSDAAEQPVGQLGTARACANRAAHLRERAAAAAEAHEADLVVCVSLENGVVMHRGADGMAGVANLGEAFVDEDENTVWMDRTCATVELVRDGDVVRTLRAWSRGVPLPLDVIAEARDATPGDYAHDATGWATTCGEVIQRKFNLDRQTWHEAVAGESRAALMREAVHLALTTPL